MLGIKRTSKINRLRRVHFEWQWMALIMRRYFPNAIQFQSLQVDLFVYLFIWKLRRETSWEAERPAPASFFLSNFRQEKWKKKIAVSFPPPSPFFSLTFFLLKLKRNLFRGKHFSLSLSLFLSLSLSLYLCVLFFVVSFFVSFFVTFSFYVGVLGFYFLFGCWWFNHRKSAAQQLNNDVYDIITHAGPVNPWVSWVGSKELTLTALNHLGGSEGNGKRLESVAGRCQGKMSARWPRIPGESSGRDSHAALGSWWIVAAGEIDL